MQEEEEEEEAGLSPNLGRQVGQPVYIGTWSHKYMCIV